MPGNIYDNTHTIQRDVKRRKNQLFLNLMEKAGGDGIAVSSTGSLIVLHPCNENARLAFMNSPHLIQFNIFSQKNSTEYFSRIFDPSKDIFD